MCLRSYREAIYEETKHLSREELKEFFAREAAAMLRESQQSQPDGGSSRRARRFGCPPVSRWGQSARTVEMASLTLRQVVQKLDQGLEHRTELLIRGGAAVLAHGLE